MVADASSSTAPPSFLRSVALTFLWSRVAIWVACSFAFLALVPSRNPHAIARDDPTILHGGGWALDIFARWDSYWFVRVAKHGYDVSDRAPAFYPLYTGAVAVAGRVLGGHYVLGGAVVSLLAALASFVLLARLAEHLTDRETALRSVLYLAIFPMSLFLQVVYSESLFLACALAAFLAAERRRFALAGVLAGLSLLTRPTGVAVVLGVAVLAWGARDRLRALAGIALAAPVFALYPLVLWIQRGEPLAFVHVERLWYRQTATLGPLGGAVQAVRAAWGGALQVTIGSEAHPYWIAHDADHFAALNLEATAFFLLYVALAVVAWRRLGAAYGLYCAASLVLPLAAPTRAQPLLSMPRFGLVLFPLFIALAALGRDRRVDRAVVGVSAVLLGVACTQWALWQFVS